MLTFKKLEEAVEVFTWAGGDQPKVIIINHEDFERIRLFIMQKQGGQIGFPGLPFKSANVFVYGSWQVHKNDIKII